MNRDKLQKILLKHFWIKTCYKSSNGKVKTYRYPHYTLDYDGAVNTILKAIKTGQ